VKIGRTYTKDRQRFECIGFESYTNRRGHSSELIILETRCATCDERFHFRLTPSKLRQRAFSRRCAVHKKPGVPVKLERKRLRDYRTALESFA
jgi:hypothetical protein